MEEIKKIVGELVGVHTEPFLLSEPLIDLASRFAHMPGTVLLMSGGESDCAQHHILGIMPWLSFPDGGTKCCWKPPAHRSASVQILLTPFAKFCKHLA